MNAKLETTTSPLVSLALKSVNDRPDEWANMRIRPANPDEDKMLRDHMSRKGPGSVPPIIVREIPAAKAGAPTYELVQGFRRFAAAKALGWDHIEARVRTYAGGLEEVLADNALENMNRKDVSTPEIIARVGQLCKTAKHAEVAAMLHLATNSVSQYNRIYSSGPLWSRYVEDAAAGKTIPGVAHIGAMLGKEDWETRYNAIVSQKIRAEAYHGEEDTSESEGEGEGDGEGDGEEKEKEKAKPRCRRGEDVAEALLHVTRALSGKGKFPGKEQWEGRDIPATKKAQLKTVADTLRWVLKKNGAAGPIENILGAVKEDPAED